MYTVIAGAGALRPVPARLPACGLTSKGVKLLEEMPRRSRPRGGRIMALNPPRA